MCKGRSNSHSLSTSNFLEEGDSLAQLDSCKAHNKTYLGFAAVLGLRASQVSV